MAAWRQLCLCLALLLLHLPTSTTQAAASPAPSCGAYNTRAARQPTATLNVHLVPHTHDDAGWLKTFEQYSWGSRQDIQLAAVQHVLSTVVQALKDNPDRKFSYAEMVFFSAWWRRQPPSVQADVRRLVAAGQLDFINGGWVQHDEAAAHYAAMIDQTTRGHRFLNSTFGIHPRVGWQIDPFGHSATQAALMSAAVGFEGLFFGRADYQDMHVRAAKRQLELLWRPSASWGEYGQVWTHNYPSGNYGPPAGFNFEWGAADSPIVDDPDSPEFNVAARVDAFVAAALELAAVVQGNDVLMMMGSDFQYSNAHANFINLDRLIHHVNADGRVLAFYSTPAAYVAAKASYNNVTWPVKTDDFMPYADCPHCYWTGYFTSRPTSKGYIRQATAHLAAARQLQVLGSLAAPAMWPGNTRSRQQPLADTGSSSAASLDALEFAVSLTQHHDSVTGTAKQHVANDYARYLFLGMQQAAELVNAVLTELLTSGPDSSSLGKVSSPGSSSGSTNWLAWLLELLHSLLQAVGRPPAAHEGQQHTVPAGIELAQCMLLNISVCAVSVAATSPPAAASHHQHHQQPAVRQLQMAPHSETSMRSSQGSSSSNSGLLVVAYNPLAWARKATVAVPVAARPAGPGSRLTVQDANGGAVVSQLSPVSRSTRQLQAGMVKAGLLDDASSAATHELLFEADLPPLGYASFALLPCPGSSSVRATRAQLQSLQQLAGSGSTQQGQPASQLVSISNGWLNLTLHAVTGRFVAVAAADGSWSLQFSQELMWYRGSKGDEPEAAATAGAAGAAGGADARGRAAHAANGGQSSGAYVFRPAGDAPVAMPLVPPEQPLEVAVLQGPAATEVRQTWASWASLTTRLPAGSDTIEQEWSVGPIPVADGVGREVVVRSSTDLASNGLLFTDSNGRELLPRKRNARPSWPLQVTEPVAGNFYPITAAAAITDGCMTLGVATDRAQGAASLEDGQLEVMLHRTTVVDDARGVGEPLNETLCGCAGAACACPAGGLPARGRHRLVLGPAASAAASLRAAQQQLNDPPILAFAQLPVQDAVRAGASSTARQQQQQQPAGVIAAAGLRGRWSGAGAAVLAARGLPRNVHLLTLMRADEGSAREVILRLAHAFQAGEDAQLAHPVSINLQELLPRMASHRELTLTAAQFKAAQSPPRAWPAGSTISQQQQQPGAAGDGSASPRWSQAWLRQQCSSASAAQGAGVVAEAASSGAKLGASGPPPFNIWDHRQGDAGSMVELFPQEIRTFLVTLEA